LTGDSDLEASRGGRLASHLSGALRAFVPGAGAEGPAHGWALDRRSLMAWFAVFTGYACAMIFTGGDDGIWGLWATGGYALTVVLAARSRRPAVPLLAAFAFAVAAPTVWLALRDPSTADVTVVTRSAMLLLHHGSPYLATGQLATWTSYDPYLPVMAIFGMPRAAGLTGLIGDTRPWLVAASLVIFAAAFWLSAPHRASRCGACRSSALWGAVLAVASPALAPSLSVGITDTPVIGLVCLALALLARSRRLPGAAGLAIGVACAMKITAWPALPVIAAMLAVRDGARVAARFTAASIVTAAALIAAAAPALLAQPGALLQNIVLFPLGLTAHKTPAASPLPGHLLAGTGPAGHLAAIGLLIAAGLAVAVSLVVRPPADVPAATLRLAIGLTLMIVLAPATRFGYFAYPLALLGWSALTRQPQTIAAPDLADTEPMDVEPVQSRGSVTS
jgi:Glycosyltransferase family 87